MKIADSRWITIAAVLLLILIGFGWAPLVVELDLTINVIFVFALGIVIWQGLIKNRKFPKI